MSDITALDVARLPCPELTGRKLQEHARRLFRMYAGDTVEVKLRFHRDLVNVVMDYFGTDTMLIPDGDKHFVFTVQVAVSPMFLSWVIGFGAKAKSLHPPGVVDRCKQLCQESLAQY